MSVTASKKVGILITREKAMASKIKIVLKMLSTMELMIEPHPSVVARASFRRGNAAGVHGPARPARARRRMDRLEERLARIEAWSNTD